MANVQVERQEGGVVMKIQGRFDFNLHNDFRDAYELALNDQPVDQFVIDLKQAEYLDSSALGMLLILRDKMGAHAADRLVINCNAEVRDILRVSNFDKLFTIQ